MVKVLGYTGLMCFMGYFVGFMPLLVIAVVIFGSIILENM